MTFSEIMALKNAGFSPDQIMTLTTSGTFPSVPDDSGADHALEAPAPLVESPAEAGEVSPSPADAGDEPKPDPFKEIRDMINGMKDEYKQMRELMQANNIRDRTIDTPHEPDPADIMKQIIRPDIHERS